MTTSTERDFVEARREARGTFASLQRSQAWVAAKATERHRVGDDVRWASWQTIVFIVGASTFLWGLVALGPYLAFRH